MSLLSREIELFDFSIGLTHWRYTDAGRDAIVEGQRYAPVALTRGRIAQSGEEAKNTLEITAPLDLPLLNLFRPTPPGLRLRLDLKRVRVRDGLVRLGWTGHVADLDETHSVAKLRCQSLASAVETLGLRRSWQSSCPLLLYGQGPGACNADPGVHAVDVVLSDATGYTVASAAFAAFDVGHFDGGVLQWNSVLGIERRFIVAHVGTTLRLLTPTTLAIGAHVTTLPGCDHTMGPRGCAKFNNTVNYGGQPTLKGLRTPFGNDPVF
ncbi:MAG: phage BR0599 family protein [Lysobacteraceae bacterium]